MDEKYYFQDALKIAREKRWIEFKKIVPSLMIIAVIFIILFAQNYKLLLIIHSQDYDKTFEIGVVLFTCMLLGLLLLFFHFIRKYLHECELISEDLDKKIINKEFSLKALSIISRNILISIIIMSVVALTPLATTYVFNGNLENIDKNILTGVLALGVYLTVWIACLKFVSSIIIRNSKSR